MNGMAGVFLHSYDLNVKMAIYDPMLTLYGAVSITLRKCLHGLMRGRLDPESPRSRPRMKLAGWDDVVFDTNKHLSQSRCLVGLHVSMIPCRSLSRDKHGER